MDHLEQLQNLLGASRAQDFVSRYGNTPLALSTEALTRFQPRGSSDTPSADAVAVRGRAMVQRAASVSAMQLGEFQPSGWTCGYFLNADGLAIIPVWGDVGPARAFWPWVWYEDVAAAAAACAKDGAVRAVLFHIDSPGGYVTGLADCAAELEALAVVKPCAAYANDYMTSAAYWMGAAAGGDAGVSGSSTAVVSSIGTLMIHAEQSKALADWGIKATVVRSDVRKAEANAVEPLTAQALAQLQHEVAVCADDFKSAIARLRGIDRVNIDATQAACLTMDQALPLRIADRIETFAEACAAVMARASAAQTPPPIITPPAASPGAKPTPQPKAARNPARGRSAKQAPAARANRSSAMELTSEEMIARREEIATIVATEPADEAAAVGQYTQIAEIVNRPAAAEEEAPADDPPAEGEETAAKAIAASPLAKLHPALAMAAISSGQSFKQFEASAKALGAKGAKGGTFDTRMQTTETTKPLGGDGGPDPKHKGATVTALPAASDVFAKRRQQQLDARAGGKR